MVANPPRASEHPAPSTATPSACFSRSPVISKLMLGAIGLTLLLAGCQTGPTPLPLVGNPFAAAEPPRFSVGDTYVYRYSDGYGNLPSGQVSYRVEQVDSDRVVMTVTPDIAREGYTRTEIYTRDGNWLRHPLRSHDQPLDRVYAAAYPAYVFPLAPGKKWSVSVIATDPSNPQKRENVRVDGRVVGAERIRVPAGEFDTIKVSRHVYIADMGYAGGFLNMGLPTHITEMDWYAPALGRVVRTERDSEWIVTGQSVATTFFLGDWHVYELASLPTRVAQP